LVLDPNLNRSIGEVSNDISRIDEIPEDNLNNANRSVTQTNQNNISSFRNLTSGVNNTTVIDDGLMVSANEQPINLRNPTIGHG
jgi:hypothetical protein